MIHYNQQFTKHKLISIINNISKIYGDNVKPNFPSSEVFCENNTKVNFLDWGWDPSYEGFEVRDAEGDGGGWLRATLNQDEYITTGENGKYIFLPYDSVARNKISKTLEKTQYNLDSVANPQTGSRTQDDKVYRHYESGAFHDEVDDGTYDIYYRKFNKLYFNFIRSCSWGKLKVFDD